VLEDIDPRAPLIRTAHRVGYAFDAPVIRTPQARRLSHWLIVGERRIALTEGENIIGRDPDVNVWLDFATLSRRHARLVVTSTGAVIEDLASKNGTSVDGVRITAAQPLRNGQQFTCGRIEMTYRGSGAALPTATELSRIVEPPARG
jgi:hypothetical protein